MSYIRLLCLFAYGGAKALNLKQNFILANYLHLNCFYKNNIKNNPKSVYIVMEKDGNLRVHVLYTFVVFVCVWWCPTFILFCLCFVFPRLVCYQFLWIVHSF
jgi:hypothetical protein